MSDGNYRINAFWDQETQSWTAQSPQIPGFACEAETLEELLDVLRRDMPDAASSLHGAPIDDFDRQVRITTAGFLACGC